MGEIMAGPRDWLTRNSKTRTNYATGLKECFSTCTCIKCRKKRAQEEQAKLKGKQPYVITDSNI